MYRNVIHTALKAWLVGLLTAALVVLPATVALKGFSLESIPGELASRAIGFAAMIPSSMLMVFTFGLVVSLPLFAIALITALMFKPQIERYPNLFALLAPVTTAVLIAGLDAATRDNPWAQSRGFPEKFGHILATGETLIYALPVLAAALYYCRRVKTPAQDRGQAARG